MIDEVLFREETPQDYEEVESLIEAAFKTLEISDKTEHKLVRRLRQSDAFIPSLSLVAEYTGKIIGHVLLTRAYIINGEKSVEVLALAPFAVLPSFQGIGVGGKLIKEAHEIATNLGFIAIVIIGHEDYYPRFGYKLASHYGISYPFEVPDENSFVIELLPGSLKGVNGIVQYHAAFFQENKDQM